jgi:hypothetical protein
MGALGCRAIARKAERMYFEGRDLTDHAEPISANDLREGQVYFAVTYVDDEMRR